MKNFINIIKGFFIGMATLVPGVSGGTMAIILGVYDDMIEGISSFFSNWKKNFLFLAQIATGSIIGIIVLSRFFESVLEKYGLEMQYLFIGAILGGLPVLMKKANEKSKIKKTDYIYFILGFALTLIMATDTGAIVKLTASENLTGYILLFLAGVIMAIALVLPGISGSFMLLALGLYDKTLNAINNRILVFLIPLLFGIAIGTLVSTKIINKCLHKYTSSTYMLIIGFVVGSIVTVFPGLPVGLQWISVSILMSLGFLLIFIIGTKSHID